MDNSLLESGWWGGGGVNNIVRTPPYSKNCGNQGGVLVSIFSGFFLQKVIKCQKNSRLRREKPSFLALHQKIRACGAILLLFLFLFFAQGSGSQNNPPLFQKLRKPRGGGFWRFFFWRYPLIALWLTAIDTTGVSEITHCTTLFVAGINDVWSTDSYFGSGWVTRIETRSSNSWMRTIPGTKLNNQSCPSFFIASRSKPEGREPRNRILRLIKDTPHGKHCSFFIWYLKCFHLFSWIYYFITNHKRSRFGRPSKTVGDISQLLDLGSLRAKSYATRGQYSTRVLDSLTGTI